MKLTNKNIPKVETQETPADVEVSETTETPAATAVRTKAIPPGKKLLLEIAPEYVLIGGGSYYIRLLSKDGTTTREVPVMDLIGLNDSIDLALTKVLEPDKVEDRQAGNVLRKYLNSGKSIEEILALL